MSNPWLKKNPFMSMWLSTANRTMGSARGQAAGAVKRGAAQAQADMTSQMLELWGVKPSNPARRKKSGR